MGAQKLRVFRNFGGVLASRQTAEVVDLLSTNSLKAREARNISVFTTGEAAKRLGTLKEGDSVSGGPYAFSQLSEDGTYTRIFSAVADPLSGNYVLAQQITNSGAAALSCPSVTAKLAVKFSPTPSTRQVYCEIWTDSAGSPGSLSSTSDSVYLQNTTTPAATTFTFSTPFTVNAGASVWLVFTIVPVYLGGETIVVSRNGATPSTRVKTYVSGVWTNSGVTASDIYYYCTKTSASTSVNGLKDYRYATSQKVLASVGGSMYAKAGGTFPLSGSWGSAIDSGLNATADGIFAFTTVQDILFYTDHGTSAMKAYNGTSVITAGNRLTLTATANATGGGLVGGTYKIVIVSALTSGGYRASPVYSVAVDGSGSNDSIDLTDITGTVFGWDLTATHTIFMTREGGTILYELPTAYSSVGNPFTSATTTIKITDRPAGSESTLLTKYNVEQGYFTSQTAAPTGCKFLVTWYGMLVAAGDGSSNLYFSSENEPNIWSTYGGLQGSVESINTNDGDYINGLFVNDGYLYVMKRNKTFMVQYTSNANAPIAVRLIHPNLGCLSHWSCKELPPGGFALLTPAGPYRIQGTSMAPLSGSSDILDRFNTALDSSYNLTKMAASTAGINTTLHIIRWGVASHSATYRDKTLTYNYETGAFWEDDIAANYYTEVTDENTFPSIWCGDTSGQVLKLDTGTNDNGSPINFHYLTADLQAGAIGQTTRFARLHIAGEEQTSGNLTVSVYTNQSTTASQQFLIPMTTGSGFKAGIGIPLGVIGRSIQFSLDNNELDVPVSLTSLGVSFEVLRESYGTA